MLKLYTDESPGLKVDPFVVMVLSIGFIISVVALHSEYIRSGKLSLEESKGRGLDGNTSANFWITVLAKVTKRFSS